MQARAEPDGASPSAGQARSVLTRRSHVGPLLVQRALYPEGISPCHAIILHPPGGIAGGDELRLEADVGPGAELLLTTPATTKVYKGAGRVSRSVQQLRVASGGCLEWFPQETQLFDAACLELSTRLELAPGARFAGWEILALGRQHSGEQFLSGSLLQSLVVHRDQRRVLHERLNAQAGSAVLSQAWGLAGRRVTGTLVMTAELAETEAKLRAALASPTPHMPPLLFGLTAVGGLLVLRALADQPHQVRVLFEAAWGAWRTAECGRAPARPRIWDT